MKKRYAGLALGLTGLLMLGCSGLVGEQAPSLPDEAPADLRVASTTLSKGSKTHPGPSDRTREETHKKGEYVIKLRPGAGLPKFLKGKTVQTSDKGINSSLKQLDLSEAANVHGFSPKNAELASLLGLERTIRIKTKRPAAQVLRLERHPDIEWVEPVVKMHSAGQPNDPYFAYQWHMKMLDVTTAWETTQGEGVVVAVVDSGVSEGQDGYHKLLEGRDFVDDDTKPDDKNGHGTHVAGTIAQAANNGVGVVGIAPKVSILPVRVLDQYGSGSNTWVANGIVWAVDHGANIINLSLGGPMPSEVVADACQYAYEQGVTVIAATGNDGYTDFIGYPAARETTIAVGAVDARKGVAFYSNQGKQIDLVAPGGDVTVDLSGDGQGDGVVQETLEGGAWGYSFFQGTSMATPHVAGAAALLYANGTTQPDDIRRTLQETADDLGKNGWDSTFGHGMVNPVAALAADMPSMASTSTKLEILNPRVKRLSDSRAVVRWKTSQPSASMLKGTDGTKLKIDEKLTVHRITVSGKKGQKVTYTIAGVVGKTKAREEISYTF